MDKLKKKDFWKKIEQKFQPIKKALNDEKWTLLKIRIEFIFRNGEKSIVSMQGSRGENHVWNISSSAKDMQILYSPDKLIEMWELAEERVQAYMVEHAYQEDWHYSKKILTNNLNTGKLTLEYLRYQSEIPGRAFWDYGYEAHFFAPIMATAFVIEGRQALEANDLGLASEYADLSLAWSGKDMLIPNPRERFSSRASEGGRAKAESTILLKAIIIVLFSDKQPKGGWNSVAHAKETVTHFLHCTYPDFVKECGLESDNLPRTLNEWIRKKPEMYLRHIKIKA